MIEQKDKKIEASQSIIAALREEVAAVVKHGEELKQIYLELVKANDDVKTDLNVKSNEVRTSHQKYAIQCMLACITMQKG